MSAERSKILFLSHLPDWGGAQHCLYLLLAGLDRARFDPVVAMPGEGALAARLRQLNIPTHALPLCWWVRDIADFAHAPLRERVETLADFIRREHCRLVFTNTLTLVEGALAARLCGVPHVWSVHELLSRDPVLVSFLEPGALYGLLDALGAAILADSHAVREEIQRYVPDARVTVAHTGLDATAQPRPSRKLELFGWPPATPVVTFAGHLSTRKGVLALAEAWPLVWRRFPEARLVVVGPDAEAADGFRRRITELGLDQAVRFLGYREDVPDIMASSDVVVLPSLADPFPVVVLEAMSQACAVVATRSGGAEEMVVDGVTGRLVPVGDPAALAAALGELLADAARREAMGRAGRERLEQCFTRQHYVATVEHVLEEVLSGRTAPGKVAPAAVWALVGLLQQGAENWVAQRRVARLEEQLDGWKRWYARRQAQLPYRVYQRLRSLGRRVLRPAAARAQPTAAAVAAVDAVSASKRLVQPLRFALLLPVYRAEPSTVLRTLSSLEGQHYSGAEVVMVLDRAAPERRGYAASLRVKEFPDFERNVSEALQTAIEECGADWVAWISAGDELLPDALLEVARFLERYPDTAAVYSDEEGWAWAGLHEATSKPEWSLELLRALNYPGNLLCVRRDLLDRLRLEGQWDEDIRYDLLLKLAEPNAPVRHLPRILYRRMLGKRDHPEGYSFDRELAAEREALVRHLARQGVLATVEPGLFAGAHRVRYGGRFAGSGGAGEQGGDVEKGGGARRGIEKPVVSIVIPTRDRLPHLRRCVESVIARTAFRDFEIIIVDNASAEDATREYLRTCGHRVVRIEEPFNYSRLNNLGAAEAHGAYVLFLNNDTEPLDHEWLDALLEQARRPDVGAVGGKLIYPSGMLQHTGVFVDADLEPKVGNWRIKLWEHGWGGTADVVMEVAAVIGACLMMERELFVAVGGFDEEMAVMWSDTDLCFKARARGRRSIYTPYARLLHHEGVSHTVESDRERADRQRFLARWRRQLESDARWGAGMMAWTLGRREWR